MAMASAAVVPSGSTGVSTRMFCWGSSARMNGFVTFS